MASENQPGGSLGERVRYYRLRRGMQQAVLAELVGRSASWLKKIESGERTLQSLPLIVALARALRLEDIADLAGPGGARGRVDAYSRGTHPAVPALREAVHAPLLGHPPAADAVSATELAGRVRQAWEVWHSSPTQRTDVGAMLPGLVHRARATVAATDGPDRRRAWAVSADLWALAQQFAAHLAEPELYWIIVDRARTAAEWSDDPVVMGLSAWVTGNGLRARGSHDQAYELAVGVAGTLRPVLGSGSDGAWGMYGSLCLHAAVTAAEDGRSGDAWRWHDEAARVTKPGYAHHATMFSAGNVAVHGVTIATDLGELGSAMRQTETADVDSIPSVERRSRLHLDAARAHAARHEYAGALHYLAEGAKISPEAIRYVPSGRHLAETLTRVVRGPLGRQAAALAAELT